MCFYQQDHPGSIGVGRWRGGWPQYAHACTEEPLPWATCCANGLHLWFPKTALGGKCILPHFTDKEAECYVNHPKLHRKSAKLEFEQSVGFRMWKAEILYGNQGNKGHSFPTLGIHSIYWVFLTFYYYQKKLLMKCNHQILIKISMIKPVTQN